MAKPKRPLSAFYLNGVVYIRSIYSHWGSVLNYWPVNQTKSTKREFMHCALLELLKLGAEQRSLGVHLY